MRGGSTFQQVAVHAPSRHPRRDLSQNARSYSRRTKTCRLQRLPSRRRVAPQVAQAVLRQLQLLQHLAPVEPGQRHGSGCLLRCGCRPARRPRRLLRGRGLPCEVNLLCRLRLLLRLLLLHLPLVPRLQRHLLRHRPPKHRGILHPHHAAAAVRRVRHALQLYGVVAPPEQRGLLPHTPLLCAAACAAAGGAAARTREAAAQGTQLLLRAPCPQPCLPLLLLLPLLLQA